MLGARFTNQRSLLYLLIFVALLIGTGILTSTKLREQQRIRALADTLSAAQPMLVFESGRFHDATLDMSMLLIGPPQSDFERSRTIAKLDALFLTTYCQVLAAEQGAFAWHIFVRDRTVGNLCSVYVMDRTYQHNDCTS